MSSGLITLIILAVLVIYIISLFNRLVALKNRYQNAFAQIDVQLKRRYDLIPNLVETAKAYMAHESKTLEAVIAARNEAHAQLKQASSHPDDGNAIEGLARAENQLGGALSKFTVTMEAYPDLKANQNMMQLTEELSSTENKVSFSRQAFNDAVTEYNSTRQSFPANILAGFFGHTKDGTLLEFEDHKEIQAAPKVSF
ncbi:MAG TPA: LemA family protein [Pseudomonadales bacterium]|nr:LemA family protein [Pseudomonadales bacterium]